MLPKTLKYGSKVESAVARSTRINIAPQNGTSSYGYGDTIIINIPTRNNLVLASTESYLKFNVKITNGTADNVFRWDSCGAHGIIQRIRIFSGSNLLEDIDSYGLLAKMLYDLQLPTDNTYGKQNILAGTRADYVLTTAGAIAGATTVSVSAVNSGDRFGVNNQAVFSAAGAVLSTDYCLNLISLVGSLSQNCYVPLFAASSAPLRVEITLVDSLYKALNDKADATGITSTLSLSDVEYVANFIELGDSAMQVIYGSLGGEPLQYVLPSFRNYQYTQGLTQNTPTQINFPIPCKFSSLKSIICSCRDKGANGAATFFPFSSVKLGLQDYQFRIGSQIIPAKAPKTDAEFFSELVKSMGSISDINYTPSIDKASYTLAQSVASTAETTNVTSNVNSGSFFIGIDAENYPSSDKSTIFSGLNTNTDDCYLIANYTSPATVAGVRWDAFANFDQVLVFENNVAYVKF